MKNILLLLLLLVLSLAAFAAGDKGNAKEIQVIKSVMQAQAADWNKGDIDGFMRGYWNSPELLFVSGDKVTRGWQPTTDNYKKSYDSREKMGVLTFSDLEVTILSKDAAVVLGSWSLARTADRPHGKFTLTFRKFKDGWKIIIDHTS